MFRADLYYELIVPGLIKLSDNVPLLCNTYLWYVIIGKIINTQTNSFLNINEIIENPNHVSLLSCTAIILMKKKAEKIFQKTTTRLENVDLPFKNSQEYLNLGDSFSQAKKRFISLENRFFKNANRDKSRTYIFTEYFVARKPFKRKDPFKCIELLIVTYGTNFAPFAATRCLNELAYKEKEKYPLAADVLLNQTYVDDALISANSLNELNDTCTELVKLLNSAGFKLHKWHSNSREFLKLFLEKNLNKSYNIQVEYESNNNKFTTIWNLRIFTCTIF
ncbi:hypothetical protein NQ317_015885 [Molorchus minor]|uniref:Reverse transcriptase domain-containing protein n=1 Tax=Molorchus minor TaxID=1323400 RepID=A0ABQ9J1M2_9CUCU|nr:hypothetical protein NQ317_015885 [Molorchus minor]